MSEKSVYDYLIEKRCVLNRLFPGTPIPDIISSYLFYDMKGIVEKRKFKTINGDPLYFHISFINNLVKRCKWVNDFRGRYCFQSTLLYQYFDTIKESENFQHLELRTKMKSVYIGPMRFCQKSGEYVENCMCQKCDDDHIYTTIVFSDSEEEEDIVF